MNDGWNTPAYWDKRYRDGRTSGPGSEGDEAATKAARVNAVIREYNVTSVVDWGVGDGTVADQITRDVSYIGVDVSQTVVARLRRKQPDRRFLLRTYASDVSAELSLSLDVMFHLITEAEYERYLTALFDSARRLVLVRSSDYAGERTARHVLWRHWTPDVERLFPGWTCVERNPDPEQIGWYLFAKGD